MQMNSVHRPAKKGLVTLMLKGFVGTLLGATVMMGLLTSIGFHPTAPFLVLLCVVVVPLTLFYLWTNRSSDNSRFDLK